MLSNDDIDKCCCSTLCWHINQYLLSTIQYLLPVHLGSESIFICVHNKQKKTRHGAFVFSSAHYTVPFGYLPFSSVIVRFVWLCNWIEIIAPRLITAYINMRMNIFFLLHVHSVHQVFARALDFNLGWFSFRNPIKVTYNQLLSQQNFFLSKQ